MTETIEPMPAQIDQQRLAQDLVEQARSEGMQLVGEDGLLTALTKSVLEAALEAEMPSTSAMTSTTRSGVTVATLATAPAPRRC